MSPNVYNPSQLSPQPPSLVKGRDEYADIATERDALREDLTDLYHTKRNYEDRVQVGLEEEEEEEEVQPLLYVLPMLLSITTSMYIVLGPVCRVE